MAGKGLQDLKQQVEAATQEAARTNELDTKAPLAVCQSDEDPRDLVTAAGATAQQVMDQATEVGQKAMDQVVKSTQETIEETASQASEAFSGFGKKLGFLK